MANEVTGSVHLTYLDTPVLSILEGAGDIPGIFHQRLIVKSATIDVKFDVMDISRARRR